MFDLTVRAEEFFQSGYAQHRQAFLAGCRRSRIEVSSIEHSLRGPSGESLAVDIARIGARTASKLLIVCSGSHGIEGFCGSAIQCALLNLDLKGYLPAGVGLLFVHALNPYGFAWLRRTDADNIDLNRNFIDFSHTLPSNSAYDELHGTLVPTDWDGPARAAADAKLQTYISARGMRALQAAVFKGQYKHPDGLVYGGQSAGWSNRVWHRILVEHATHAEAIAVLDVHSGLGAPGACELISGARGGTREFAVAKTWFGDSIVFPGATSTAPAASGYMGDSLTAALPRRAAALVVAEFGTVDFDTIFSVLREDNWVHSYEQPASAAWKRAKSGMYDAFVRPEPEWKSAVIEQGITLVDRVSKSLAATNVADFV
jgi:hypothetical protein